MAKESKIITYFLGLEIQKIFVFSDCMQCCLDVFFTSLFVFFLFQTFLSLFVPFFLSVLLFVPVYLFLCSFIFVSSLLFLLKEENKFLYLFRCFFLPFTFYLKFFSFSSSLSFFFVVTGRLYFFFTVCHNFKYELYLFYAIKRTGRTENSGKWSV